MSTNPSTSGKKFETPISNPRSRHSVQFQTPRSTQTGTSSSQKLQCSVTNETTPDRRGLGSQGPSARRLAGAFKSPLRILNTNPPSATSPTDSEDVLKIEILELRQRNDQLEQEIQNLKTLGCREEELKDHIEKLHEYNEMKDVGQMLLGRLAVLQQTTTRELYQKYGLELED